MNFKLEYLDENYAKQICSWKYNDEYSVYNYPEWESISKQNWAITVEEKRKNEFVAVINKCFGLCGYIRFNNNYNYVLVGLGLKPDLCGQGLGYKLMDILKSESRRRYNNKTIILEVRSFNKRAINCYKKSGFKVLDIYKKDTLLGYDEFVKMELTF